MMLRAKAEDPTSGEVVEVEVPVEAFVADIEYDLLLGYDWLARSDLLLYAKANALLVPGRPVRWLWGNNAQRKKYKEIMMMEPGDRQGLTNMCSIMSIKEVWTPRKPRGKLGKSHVTVVSRGGGGENGWKRLAE